MVSQPQVGIVVFPGSNCDRDVQLALWEVYELETVFINAFEEKLPDNLTHIILPGGFSYGDYLRAGAMAARAPIMSSIVEFALSGAPVMGICNGFQILCEAKLLPGALLKNHHNRFVCQNLMGKYFSPKTPNKPMEMLLSIAHQEGRYFAEENTMTKLKDEQRILLQYCDLDEEGNAKVNGSLAGIAGIVGGSGRNIWGMMPHPERLARPDMGSRDGCLIFQDFLFGN